MKYILNRYLVKEDGAVTVDWVVLTAAVVALAVAAYTAISDGSLALTDETSTFIENQSPGG